MRLIATFTVAHYNNGGFDLGSLDGVPKSTVIKVREIQLSNVCPDEMETKLNAARVEVEKEISWKLFPRVISVSVMLVA